MKHACFAGALAALALCALGPARAEEHAGANVRLTPAAAATSELVAAVTAADTALFAAVFDTCDIDALAAMVTDDMEFFHDKHGQTARSGAEFIDSIRAKCDGQRDGSNFLSRRELVHASLETWPLPGYGALQSGEHRFYALAEGQPDRLVETGRFTHVWKNEEGRWRLARVLSYDHVIVR